MYAAIVSALALVSVSSLSNAAVVENGAVLNIDSTTPLDTYFVTGAGSTLNGTNAPIRSVSLTNGGTLTLNGGSVQSETDGITVNNSTATITNTTIVGDFLGLSVNRPVGFTGGSLVQVTGGSVQGFDAGAQVTGLSRLQLSGTRVTGTGAGSAGLNIYGGDAVVTNGSVIQGDEQGVLLISDANDVGDNRLILEGSTVEGVNGAAILVDVGVNADIQILNNAVLKGGNGNLLEVEGNSTANVQVSRAALEGDVQVAQGSAANLTFNQAQLRGDVTVANGGSATLSLQNGSTLTGTLTGIDTLNLSASTLTGNVNATGAGRVSLTSNAVLNGNISSNNVSLDASVMTGDITSITPAGPVALTRGSALEGDIRGSDSVSLDASSVTGNVTSASESGQVSLVNGSDLNGNANSNSISLDNSSMTGNATSLTPAGIVALSHGSSLKGAINGVGSVNLDASSMAGSVTSGSHSGQVSLVNGSVLNGNVSSDNVSLSASAMTGDITSLDGNGVVSLQNDSVFTGNLINVDQLTVGDPSIWNMAASNSINTLVMDTGIVKFGAANEFFQLNVGTLSGTGTFIMDVDYATNEHDTLVVSGSATGSHTLQIAGSGVDPVSPEQLTLVRTGGGDATFALAGAGVVDAGAYSYALGSVANGTGTDWFLDPSTKTISPGTRSVLALFNTAPTVWYGELTSLRSRMGELRFNGGKAGGWARSYGNKYNVDEASGLGYRQTQQGFSLGADAPLPIGDGQWLIGVLAGHSKSDLNVSRGTSGTVKSYYAGVYTTWLDQDSGYYFDGVLKFNRFRNDSKVGLSDGTRAKGDYDNVGMGGSVEFGRHIKLNDGYFVEPFTQLSAVVIQGKDYRLDNDMQAEGDRTRSMLGKVGVTAGRNFVLDNGSVLQPYLRVAGVHEFAKNNEVQVNDNQFNNDLSGSRGELGAGVAVAFSDNLQLHADFDYANGEHVEQPFGANVGLRYSW